VAPASLLIFSGSHLTHRIFRVPLSAGARGYLTIGKLSAPASALFCSPSSTYLIALSANKAYAFRLPVGATSSHDWKITSVKFVSDQPLTCGAFAPADTLSNREEWFATGDQRGVIRLWHGLGAAFRQLDAAAGRGAGVDPTEERRLPTTSLHWHAHAVAAIAFNPSGSQLLSVGEESVLVQWHLASGKREYIPRLGGRPIITLGVKAGARGAEEEWWMTLADGGVVRVGAASGQVNNVGQGIRLDPLRPTSNKPYPLAVHPSTSSLVVSSSHASTLQFIDPQVPSVLFDLEVAPSNRVARKEEREVEPVAVEKVAFSSKKHDQIEWMATMESRVGDLGEGGGAVRNLKIWKWLGER
jgi:NET1-associated nuclear protein 1 (U3 small nucleolar RNA-associated protein 17)